MACPQALPGPVLLGEPVASMLSPSWIRRKSGVLFHSHCLRKPGDVWIRQPLRVEGGGAGGGGWRVGLEGRGGSGDPRKLDLE